MWLSLYEYYQTRYELLWKLIICFTPTCIYHCLILLAAFTKYLWFMIPCIYFTRICKRYLLDWKVSNIFPVINNMFIKTNICCRRYKIVVEVENVEIMSGSEVLHGFALFLIALARVIHYTNLFYGHMQWHQYFLIIYNYIETNDFSSITS